MAKRKKYKYRIIPKERRQKMNPASRKIISGLAVLSVVFIIGILFMKSDHFTVKNILVNGNENLSETEIINASGIAKGQNLFEYNTKKSEKAILTLSYTQSVEITREFPDTVHIYIKEKPTTMAYLSGGIYHYLDGDGNVMKAESTLVNSEVMAVSFAENDGLTYSVGDVVDFSADPRLGLAKSVYTFSVKNELTPYISEFYVSASGVNYIYTTRSNVIKFYTFAAFEENAEFIKDFITYEDRHIMAEVVEDSRPVYKVIDIQ